MRQEVQPGRLAALGLLLMLAGAAGVWAAWFPAPPFSTLPPLEGWPARWFAAGIGWFGAAVLIAGARRDPPARRLARWVAALATACCASCLAALALTPWLDSPVPFRDPAFEAIRPGMTAAEVARAYKPPNGASARAEGAGIRWEWYPPDAWLYVDFDAAGAVQETRFLVKTRRLKFRSWWLRTFGHFAPF